MQSANTSYFARLDALRFIAAVMVLSFHAVFAHLSNLFTFNPCLLWIKEGHRGVNLFFALSGFLFALIVGQSFAIEYKPFIINRCLRIMPLLLFVFLITAAIFRNSWHSYDLLGLLFLQLYLPEYQNLTTLGTSWTISVEFVFYLLFPYLHIFTNRYGERYLIALISLFVIMRLLSHGLISNELSYFFTLLGRFDILLVGMLAGRYYLKHPRVLVNRYALPLTFLLATGYLLLITQLPHSLLYLAFYPPIEGLLWSLLIICCLNSTLRWQAFEQTLAKLGSISYSIYLLHPFILYNVQALKILENNLTNALLVCFAISLPLTLILSYLTFYTIEQPFLSFRQRYLKPTSP